MKISTIIRINRSVIVSVVSFYHIITHKRLWCLWCWLHNSLPLNIISSWRVLNWPVGSININCIIFKLSILLWVLLWVLWSGLIIYLCPFLRWYMVWRVCWTIFRRLPNSQLPINIVHLVVPLSTWYSSKNIVYSYFFFLFLFLLFCLELPLFHLVL